MKVSFNKIRYLLFFSLFSTIILYSCDGFRQKAFGESIQIKKPEPLRIKPIQATHEINMSENHTKLSKRLDSLMRTFKKRYGFKGNVLVANKGVVVLNKSVGFADYRHRNKLTEDLPFQIASVSKQFTAVAAMMLIEKGKLSFNDTVSHIIEGFPYKNVTVEQLLNHTSGLPNYMWLLEHKFEGEHATNKDIIDLMIEHKTPPYFAPGRKYHYCNTGYAVLAYVIELVTSMPFVDYMDQHIFDRLGMNHTFIYSNAIDKVYPKRATGHYYKWKRYNPYGETIHDGIVGDKGVYSTTSDLLIWDQALYSEVLISNETKEKAFTPVKVRGRYQYPYGYGFRLKENRGKKVVYHTGVWEGFRTNLMRYVEDQNTIIILNNTNSKLNSMLINKIEDVLASV